MRKCSIHMLHRWYSIKQKKLNRNFTTTAHTENTTKNLARNRVLKQKGESNKKIEEFSKLGKRRHQQIF